MFDDAEDVMFKLLLFVYVLIAVCLLGVMVSLLVAKITTDKPATPVCIEWRVGE